MTLVTATAILAPLWDPYNSGRPRSTCWSTDLSSTQWLTTPSRGRLFGDVQISNERLMFDRAFASWFRIIFLFLVCRSVIHARVVLCDCGIRPSRPECEAIKRFCASILTLCLKVISLLIIQRRNLAFQWSAAPWVIYGDCRGREGFVEGSAGAVLSVGARIRPSLSNPCLDLICSDAPVEPFVTSISWLLIIPSVWHLLQKAQASFLC